MNWVSFPQLGIGKIFINDYIFEIFGLTINFYAVIFSLAIMSSFFYCYKIAHDIGVLKPKFAEIVCYDLIFGIFGARFYYVIFNLSEFFKNASFVENVLEFFNLRTGGIAIYGGLIFSVLFGIFICKVKRVKVLPMLDLVSIGFLLGQSIGRWGNFFNIEAYGTKTTFPWGMVSNKIAINNCPAHPTFLYESLWCALGFLILNLIRKKRKFDGELFFIYLAWYGFERFFVEQLRVDSLMLFQTNIRVSQMVSFILFFVSIIALIYLYFDYKNNRTKLFIQTSEWKQELRLL